MALELQQTVLNDAPFWDDYNEADNYHRILFRPGVAVQARELTQLQTILQNQIERFGENIFRTGTVIKGCAQSFDSNYQYIKILDNQADGQPCNVELYANTLIVGTANLRAYVVNTIPGLQTQDPDLNTLYIKYLNTGTGGEKTFSIGSTVTCFHRDRRVENVQVLLGGTGYSNTDTVSFTSDTGEGAVGTILTFANGTISEVLLNEKGSGYAEAPGVNITTTNGVGAQLVASVEIAQLLVANNTYTEPVGAGYAVIVSDGFIFQKGHFVRFPGGTAVVSKYTTAPNNAIVGFSTTESIANSSNDTNLLDNSSGSLNFKAPGAYRLKLVPELVVKTKQEAAANASFFGIVEFENGKRVRQSEDTQYNVIGNQMAKRTYEESGNYVVSRFAVSTESITSNTTHINASVGTGIAYVEGHRVENLDNIRVPVRKAIDTTTDFAQSISTNYGNYVLVNEMAGSFNASVGATVSLRSAVGQNLSTNAGGTPTTPGVQIGVAKIRAVEYETGDVGTPSCVYRLYLFDVVTSGGRSFADVRAISVAGVACGDVILQNNLAVIQESDYNSLVFETGTDAIAAINAENFIYRAQITSTGLFNVTGTATITLSGAEEFPYTPSRTLNDTQERDFVIIPTNSTFGSPKTGTVQTFGNTTVSANSGSTTSFLTQYNVGESIRIGSSNFIITRIVTDSRLEVHDNVAANVSQAHTIAFPAFVPVRMSGRPGASIAIDSTGKIATITLGNNVGTLNAAMNAAVHFNSKVVGANIVGATQVTKSITKGVYVKISGSQLASKPNGPWSLGHADVHSITGVFQGSGSTYSEVTDITSSFILDNGQTDNLYGLATLSKRVGGAVNLTPDDNLLVKMDVYTRNAGYYISAESYPVDDVSSPLPGNKIRTENIELFTSTSNGRVFDLRDCLDFRPAVSNTATLSTSAGSATIDPSDVNAMSGNIVYFPAPNATFTGDIVSFMRRVDRITLDSKGQIRVTEGTASNFPTAPLQPAGTMTLALVQVPPYPTLPTVEARVANRPDLGVSISLVQQRRYTMKDIQDIESRIARLEYYSLLNTLEQSTKNLVIPSELDTSIDRFKNGFFVDPFDNYDIANTIDPEYRMFIDVYNSEARPVVNQYNVEMEFRESNNDGAAVKRGDAVILDYEEVEYMSQPYATRVRNCMEATYSYKGRVITLPAYDNFYDTTITPQSIDVDIAGAIEPLVNSINAAFEALGGRVTINSTTTNETLVGTNRAREGNRIRVTQVWDQAITRSGTLTEVGISTQEDQSTRVIGDYVTNFALNPYIRPQAIRIMAVGLRPGAQHFIFFDKRNVSQLCQPAIVEDTPILTEDSFFLTGLVGDAIFADEGGVVSCVLYVPAGTFFVGEREIMVMDTNLLESESAAISRAIGQFNAYNFDVNKQQLSLNTRTVSNVRTTIDVTPYVQTTRGSVSRTTFVAVPNDDPVAQTFRVQTPVPGTDGTVLTSIDLFFQRKDPVQGVVLEIREVQLGTPTTTVVPNGVVRLPSSSVVTSPDASQPTTFVFESPVYLKADAEYAFVVYPEAGSPEYLIWTGETGGTDVTDSNLIKRSDWGLGVLFLSSNGSAWSASQFEDVKFVLRRARFISSSATVNLTPRGYEFLTVQGKSGAFTPGELVAQKALTYGPGLAIANTTSRTLTGTNTAYAVNLSVGDRILLTFGTNQSTAKSGTVSGGTTSGAITGSSTDFASDYAVGDYIRVGSSIREIIQINSTTSMVVDAALSETLSGAAHFSVVPQFAIAKVLAIASSTSITLDVVPAFISTTGSGVIANYQKVVTGVVDQYNSTTTRLTIKNSAAANSTFRFNSGLTVVGGRSQATASTISVDNINVSFIEPHVQTFVPSATSSSYEFSVSRASNNQIVTFSGRHGITNRLPFPATLRSRSNEISGTTWIDSFKHIQFISTVTDNLSPIIDTTPGTVVFIENLVDNFQEVQQSANTFSNTTLQTNTSVLAVGMSVGGLGVSDGTVIVGISGSNATLSLPTAHTIDAGFFNFTSNEEKPYGISINRYISKRLALEEGLDAEDIRVFLTAYRPQGTEVEVYAKILNGSDTESFNTKDWSRLVMTTNESIRSDSLNPRDYREYVYTFKNTPPSIRVTGTVTTNTSNSSVEGFGTEFDSELVVGDLVKLVRTTDEVRFDIRRVENVTDFKTVVLDRAPSFSDDGVRMHKLTQPHCAFKCYDNDGVVRYYNNTGAFFDGYKFMALKIVLRAADNAIVPTIQDVRALAVSI